MLLLAAIVFLYKQHIVMPDLATAFGELNAAYNSYTISGGFGANDYGARYEAAVMQPAQNTPQVYVPNGVGGYSVDRRGYPVN